MDEDVCFRRRRIGFASFLAIAGALLLASTAAAEKERIHLTAAGQAAAQGAVLTRADIGPAAGWTGGPRKPELSSAMPCNGFKPKQSDLVLIGAAKSLWKHPGLEIDSEAQVLQTAAMVRLDWRRTVLAPQMLSCLRTGLAKGLPAGEQLVSFDRLPFPQAAPYIRAYRALIDVQAGTGTVRVMTDLIVFGRGRTEITLSTTAPSAAVATVKAAEIRLVHLLAGRIRS